jgi:hypothetical protein
MRIAAQECGPRSLTRLLSEDRESSCAAQFAGGDLRRNRGWKVLPCRESVVVAPDYIAGFVFDGRRCREPVTIIMVRMIRLH